VLAALSVLKANAQDYAWTTWAGVKESSGTNDGAGSSARFYGPHGTAVDSNGNVYVADTYNDTIRKVTPAGVVTTLAGLAGSSGTNDDTGSAARFNEPNGLAVDGNANVFVADTGNHTIRKITPAGEVTTLAGLAGSPGTADGTGTVARFFNPNGVAVDDGGIVYVADTFNHAIRKITSAGEVTTLAGLAGSYGTNDGTSSTARFFYPDGVAVDSDGNVYVADTNNHTIRKITPAGVVSTLAGLAGVSGTNDGTTSAARFNGPSGVAVDNDRNIYVTDTGNSTIRKIAEWVITPCGPVSVPGGLVTTVGGLAGRCDNVDGTGTVARFFGPSGVTVDQERIVYVGDASEDTIRKGVPLGDLPIPMGLFTNSWTNPAGSRWEDPGNWSLCLAPAIDWIAMLITNANSKTVFLDSATATNTSTLTINNLAISAMGSETNTLQIDMGGPSATLNVLNGFSVGSGGAVTVSNSALTAGGVSNGYFTIDGNVAVLADAAVLGSTVYLGSGTGANGVVSLNGGSMACRDRLLVGGNGAGTVWESGGQLVATNILSAIGFLGPGQLTISNGVALAGDLAVGCYTQGISTAANALTVAGGQLTTRGNYTMIGCSGAGQMSVANGGTVALSGFLSVGIDKGTGVVWVVGGQLAVTNGDTFVGSSGSGSLVLSKGGFRANAVYVGSDPFLISLGSAISGAVTGNVTGGISEGTLTAAGGTLLVYSNLLVGADVGATGTVWATGGQIIATNNATAIGYSGIGRMTVSNGTVETLGMFVGQLGDSQGTLTMAGGTLISWGDAVVGDCATNATGHVAVDGGDLFVINASHNAVLEVRQGTLIVNSGLLLVDTLVATNPCAQVVHNGGLLIYDKLVLDPNGDNDGDGMPNGWEQSYGLDPFNAADANLDLDGDGFSNLQEYQAGTDPTNSASALRITELEPDDEGMLVTWAAVGGKRYVLQTTTGDDGGFSNNFVDLNPAIVAPGTGATEVTVLHLGATTNTPSRFYRVRLLPSP